MRDDGHVWDTQPDRHDRLKSGIPPPPKSKQPNTHVRLSPQLFSSHIPQSLAQLMQSSKREGSQRMLPQNAHEPQSAGQLEQSSVPLQRPSPHPVQRHLVLHDRVQRADRALPHRSLSLISSPALLSSTLSHIAV